MRAPLQLLIVLCAAPVLAGVPKARLASVSDLTLALVMADGDAVRSPAGDALLDVGVVSGHPRARPADARSRGGESVRAVVVRHTVSVLLQSRSGRMRFARVRAFLSGAAPRSRVRVDGILLSEGPQLIDAAAPIGRAVKHVLEIEVPASAPEGQLDLGVTWLAEAD